MEKHIFLMFWARRHQNLEQNEVFSSILAQTTPRGVEISSPDSANPLELEVTDGRTDGRTHGQRLWNVFLFFEGKGSTGS